MKRQSLSALVIALVMTAAMSAQQVASSVADAAAKGDKAAVQKLLKDAKLKVQASIQGDALRVSGATKDDLQAAIQLVRTSVKDLPLQFINFRD